jgi:hypothetical protein
MGDYMYTVLESKCQTRKRLAELPFAEKLLLLEKLRDRSEIISAGRLRRRAPTGRSSLLILPTGSLGVMLSVWLRWCALILRG